MAASNRSHRRRLVSWIATYLAVMIAVPAVTLAQDSSRVVRGIVTDTLGRAIPFANVVLGVKRVVADDSGRFRMPVPAGERFDLEFRRIGFRPERLTFPGIPDSALRVALLPLAYRLQAQVITSERSRSLDLHGFYERLRDRENGLSTGYFITEEDIERRNYPKVTRMFDGVPAMRVVNGGTAVGGVPMGTLHSGCLMTIYVDGGRVALFKNQSLMENQTGGLVNTVMLAKGKGIPPFSSNDTGLDNYISSSSVAGIEVYTRATGAPKQYGMLNGTCGVILIWTK